MIRECKIFLNKSSSYEAYGKDSILFCKLSKNKRMKKQDGEIIREFELEFERDYFTDFKETLTNL